MNDINANVPFEHENSRSVVEAAIDLSRSTKDGTWEEVVRKSVRQKPYSKTDNAQRSRPNAHRKKLHSIPEIDYYA
jgi:hypothetical protein